MELKNILLEHQDAVVTMTINRPHVMNALDSATIADLNRAMQYCGEDDAVRVVILTGAGPKAFVAGADIGEFESLTVATGKAFAERGQGAFSRIERLGKPVIAAVNGYALGGGCELAMACTLRIASDRARFGQPEVNLGIMTGYGGSQRLPGLVGKGVALELLLTGRLVEAQEALAIGLVNRVVPAEALMSECQSLASQLATKPPLSLRYTMEAANRGPDMGFDAAQTLEATLFGLLMATQDKREGTAAFVEKRAPTFSGR